MASFDQQEFNEFILEHRVVSFLATPLILPSRRASHFYVNWRTVTQDVSLANDLASFIMDFAEDRCLGQQTFFGVPESASKIALITQFRYALERTERCAPGDYVLAMGRGKEKHQGDVDNRYFLGFPQGKTVVIEEVVTTGDSLLSTIDQLVRLDILVTAALSLTDRNECFRKGNQVERRIRERSLPYFAMSNASDLLPLAYRRYRPPREIARAIEREFERYRVHPAMLL